MARLPDANALGGLPSASSGRQISSIDGSGIGQGMQNMASGMRALAQGQNALAAGQEAQGRGFARAGQQIAQGLDIAARSFKQDDDLNDAQVRSDFLVEKIKLDNERDNERDPEKLRAFPDRYKKLVEPYAARYADPRRKQKFLIDTQDDITRGSLQAGDRQIKLENNQFTASSMQELETLRRAGLESKDEVTKQKVVDQGIEKFRLLREKGVITPAEEVSARQKWVRDYTIDSVKMLPPEQRLVATQGNTGALKVRESGADPTKENKYGFAGFYQFGAPRLQTIGVYQPGAGENLSTWNQTGKTEPGKWSGTFNIPGFPNVRTKDQFLASPAAQEKAYEIHQQKITQEIKANGLEKYIGQTVGGVKITEDGIRNMMHLGGAGGAKLFLESGGVINRADANGTKLSEYAAMGSNSSASKMMSFLDPLERKSIEDGATQELMQQTRLAEQEARQFQAVKTAERNAIIDDLEIGLKEDRYGPAEAMKARNDGLLTDPEKYNRIEKLVKDQGERIERRSLSDGIINRTIQYNPTNPEHVKALEERVEFAARATGQSKEKVGAEIYEHTGTMPKAVVQSMRGRLVSGKEDDIIAVGEMAGKAMYGRSKFFETGNPRAFDGFDGGKEISDIGVMWAHFRGMMPKETDPDGYGAARRIMELRDPKFTSGVKMDGKEELEFKKNIKETALKDLKSADVFGSAVITSNQLPPDGLRAQMEEDYAVEVLHYYKKHGGNEALARDYGKLAIKALYGVSNGVLQKFPVEKALPNMQIPDSGHKWVYEAAAQKVGNGVKPEDIILSEIPLITSNAFRTQDQGVQYEIVYRKDIGNGQKALEKFYGTFIPAQHFAEAYRKDETKRLAPVYAERANLRAAEQQQERLRQGQVTLDDVPSVGVVGKRPLPPAERETMRQDMEKRVNEVRGLYPNAAKLRDERGSAVAAESDDFGPGLQGVADWVKSTPANPLKGFVKSNSRNRLPGGDK